MSGSLTKRDSLRLAYWSAEEDIVDFSNRETRRFESSLNWKLSRERFGLLLKNHLERMGVIVSGIEHWVSIHKELLEKDVDGTSATIKKIEHHQEQMKQIKSLMKSTLSGSTDEIMKELKANIDRFFNIHPGSVLKQTLVFVNQYSVSVENYREKLTASGFSNTLRLIFQEFNQALDTFMAETINPEIARFLKEIEDRIQTHLDNVARPFQVLASDVVAELKTVTITPNMKSAVSARNSQNLLNMDALKRVAGLSLPSSTAALRYSTKLRTEAVMRLGFYSVVKLFKKVFKKPLKNEKEEQMSALADSVGIIKRETEKSIVFHFENYRENFKFQYVSKLIEAAAEHLHQILMERYRSYDADLMTMEKVMEKKGLDRENMIDFLDRVAEDALRIKGTIDRAREKLKRESDE